MQKIFKSTQFTKVITQTVWVQNTTDLYQQPSEFNHEINLNRIHTG